MHRDESLIQKHPILKVITCKNPRGETMTGEHLLSYKSQEQNNIVPHLMPLGISHSIKMLEKHFNLIPFVLWVFSLRG